MKNLIPLKKKKAYWDEIVRRKRPVASRNPLRVIRPRVVNRFVIYSNLATPNILESMPVSPFLPPIIDSLKSCYSKSNALSALKKRIINRQSFLLRSECQYCNISEPSTFDHYLPQRYFPEFSALSINLIPCCPKCNTDKGDNWLLANGRRKIINFYYDTLPNIQYLDCDIVYKGAVPQANFSLNLGVIPITLRDTIVSHFQILKLASRYEQKSNSEITDVMNTIIPMVGLLNRVQIQAHLMTEAVRMKADRGVNYWRAVLKIALSNSNTFLTNSGY